ncbi:MAG: response regulator [Candidatus Omnitrophica bacterium]|nr:response regulator [Candidatus Omnitrophota bacterium]
MNNQILLIEDDVLVLKSLEKTLKNEGYVVKTAKDGQSGLKLLQEGNFNLVISDIRMPGIDGIQTIEKLRTSGKGEMRQVPVILITGYASEEAPIDAFRLKVSDYILKPFNNDELLATVKRVLENAGTDSSEMKDLLIQVKKLLHQYREGHERQVFEDQDLRRLLDQIDALLFSIEKEILKHTPIQPS